MMHCRRILDPAGPEVFCHLLYLRTCQMRGNADYAHTANGENRQGQAVVAGVNRKPLRHGTADIRHLIQVSAGLLDSRNTGNLRQSRQSLGKKVDPCSPGDVVDHARQINAFGNGLKVLIHSLLRRFVVIGHYEQKTVNSGLLGSL